MKKLYSIFATMLLSLVSMTAVAQEFTVTFNVDESNRLYYTNEAYEEIDLVAGENKITFTTDQPWFVINVRDGFGISSFVDAETGEEVEQMWGSYCLALYAENGDKTYNIKTYNEEEARTGEMPIWVDDASKVSISYMPSYKLAAPLQDGDNIFKYNPETETTIRIRCSDWDSALYKVLVNGESVESDDDAFLVTCSPENRVQVFANFPDVDVPVTFTIVNEGTEGAISGVTVDQMPVEEFLGGMTVKMGQRLGVEFNTQDYNILSFTLNGEPVEDFSWGWSRIVTEDKLDFVITAERHRMIPFTLVLSNPKAVTVYKGEMWDEVMFTDLVEGENQLEISTASPMITVIANSGATINSITKNGEEVFPGWMGYGIEIAEGDVIAIDAQALERSQTATIWLDDASKAEYQCGMNRSDDTPYDDDFGMLYTGENTVKFTDSDNPFYLIFAGLTLEEGDVKVYVNDSEESLIPYMNNSFILHLSDGDYVKVFLDKENATGISIAENTANRAGNAVYNLAGQRVGVDYKGIAIKNGKKFIVK